jgi:hypothetical protein
MKEHEAEQVLRELVKDFRERGKKTVWLRILNKRLGNYINQRDVTRAMTQLARLHEKSPLSEKDFYYLIAIATIQEEELVSGQRFNQRSIEHSRGLLCNACFLLRLLLSKDEAEAIEGDLLENYARDVKQLGRKRAVWLAYRQVAISLWPLLKRLLYKLGTIAWITNVVRRLIG